MKTQTITGLKSMRVEDIRGYLPFELTADGEVIAVLEEKYEPKSVRTQCPNCKLIYNYTEPDEKPPFFTTRHP